MGGKLDYNRLQQQGDRKKPNQRPDHEEEIGTRGDLAQRETYGQAAKNKMKDICSLLSLYKVQSSS